MRISARADYAVRAALFLARSPRDTPMPGESIAAAQQIPAPFLEGILAALRRAGIVESRRGANGGYRLAGDARAISVADVIRAVDGPLVYVRNERPSELEYPPGDEDLVTLWVALRASVRRVLDDTSLAELAEGDLPTAVRDLADDPDSWVSGR
ncbi:Rrf2 family protein [Microbacterium terrae]|uniref:HTH-type transcriptional regulator CymR n=1 Tax=Microbacterium terrae TaxID=69369 RepID=A0A0M2HHF4_9MICO|nr:Rrf2 family transcriptional regulator [Microbacterium terrae]KJL44208.1 HTH-type transcriptional regulator CymR [Microbacterium terrae]MBP1078748.1 Rrf2 family protein [Microbacterium terrae]GLJ98149.1 putative HTH-type transcriptional regulator [Microbacterium terrae]